eukprot:gene10170-biopygen15309
MSEETCCNTPEGRSLAHQPPSQTQTYGKIVGPGRNGSVRGPDAGRAVCPCTHCSTPTRARARARARARVRALCAGPPDPTGPMLTCCAHGFLRFPPTDSPPPRDHVNLFTILVPLGKVWPTRAIPMKGIGVGQFPLLW